MEEQKDNHTDFLKNKNEFFNFLKNNPMPVAIVISVLIISSFYYSIKTKEINEKIRIENSIRAEVDQKNLTDSLSRLQCKDKALSNALSNYKRVCEEMNKLSYSTHEDCSVGLYNRGVYQEEFDQCLKESGVIK